MPFGGDGISIFSPQVQGLITLVMLALTLTLFYYIMLKTQPKKVEEKTVTKTLIRCNTCDYSEEREFKRGDFVGKEVGSCPKDNGTLIIRLIYSEKIEMPDKRG